MMIDVSEDQSENQKSVIIDFLQIDILEFFF
jgi:hypothetical protein